MNSLFFFIVTDFDFVFHEIWPKQQKMVSIEEIMAIQKREEAAQKVTAQKQQQLTEKADQGPPNAKGQSSVSKGREKVLPLRRVPPDQTNSCRRESLPVKEGRNKKSEGAGRDSSSHSTMY